jgi:hypothetical protein
MVQLQREVQSALSGDWPEVRESVIGTTLSVVADLNDLLRGASTAEISTSLFALPRQLSDSTSELAKITNDSGQARQPLLALLNTVDKALDELQRLRDSPAFQV